jgi:DNA repair exonuclease SbcCD ATPase subunit
MSSADDPLIGAAEGSREERSGLRARLTGQAEDTIGKLADDLLENPVFNSALTSAFAAREKMAQAQQSAMGALNLPSASDLDKLARRLRSISQRLEEVEDGVETLGTKLDSMSDQAERPARELAERLERIESRVDQLALDVSALRRDTSGSGGLAGEPPAIVPEG